MQPNSKIDESDVDRRPRAACSSASTLSSSPASLTALVRLYHLSDYGKGWTVAIALIGTVVGSFSAGVVGQKLGGRETLRITAVLYVISALGSALAWSWPSLMVFRFIGGLASAPLRYWVRFTLRNSPPPSGAEAWWARFSSTWSSESWWPTPRTTSFGFCTGRGGVALAGRYCRGSRNRVSGPALQHSTQPPLVRLKEQDR